MNVEQFPLGTLVKKKSGSEWEGIICGYYQPAGKPVGVCIESIHHKGSIQLYPSAAIQLASE